MSTQSRATTVFRKVFGDSSLELRPELTANDVEGWDSLAHIRLIVSLEKEFKIKFKTTEVISFKNVGELLTLIEAKIGSA
ncbi:MAG: acyl carrier protein [Bdellovibrionales bacterium]|nr:acyl carrier protein [Bdellovibrionales bacterium]